MCLAFKHVFLAYLGCVGGMCSSFRNSGQSYNFLEVSVWSNCQSAICVTAELKKEAIYLINEINHEDSDINFILFIEYTTANNISKR